jgi:adenylate cyclase class IV
MAQKLDQTKVAQVLRDGAIALTKVAAERDAYAVANEKLAAENNTLRLRMEAEKVAMDMHDKGIHSSVPFERLVEQLEKRAHADPHGFAVTREAVGLTGPDMSKTASVASDVQAPSGSDFERFIFGNVG